MSMSKTLENADFIATDAQVEQLAREVLEGVRATGTYLKALVAACQVELKGKRKDVIGVIDQMHERFYAAVIRVTGTDDPAEQTRRATFARTAASTLRAFVKGGGNIKTLHPWEVSKSALRAAIHPPEPTDRTERIFHRARDSIVRRFKAEAKRDPARARDQLIEIIETLQDAIDNTPEVRVTSMRGVARQRATASQHATQ